MDPIISIIVPVYNVELYLERCIESILNQSFKDIEIILIDDGSTDLSGKICDRYVEIDDRIICIHQKNMGVSSARNKGIEISRGQYIGFIDSDDLVHKDMYKILYEAINKYNVDISCCNAIKLGEDKIDSINIEEIRGETKVLTQINIFKHLYGNSNDDFKYIALWNKLISKDILGTLKFEDTGSEDLVFNNVLFSRVKKMAFVNQNLYFWITHKQSLSHKKFNERNVKILDSYESSYKFLDKYMNEKISSLCLTKFIKVILNTRYNSKNTDLFVKVDKKVKELIKKYEKDFLKDRNISLKEKIILYIFLRFPYIYNIFRKLIS